MPGWIVQRSTLLDQLQTRYGNRKEGAAEGSELALATAIPKPPTDQPNPSTAALPSRTMAKPVSPVTSMAPTSSSTDNFRVSRKVAFPRTNPETSPKANPAPSTSVSETSEESGGSEAAPFPQQSNDAVSKKAGEAGGELFSIKRPAQSPLILPKRMGSETSESAPNTSENSGGVPIVGVEIPTQGSDRKTSNSSPALGTNASLVLRKTAPVELDESSERLMSGESQSTSQLGNASSSGELPSFGGENPTARGNNSAQPEITSSGVSVSRSAVKTDVSMVIRKAIAVKSDEQTAKSAIALKEGTQTSAVMGTTATPMQTNAIGVSSTRAQLSDTLPLGQTQSSSLGVQRQSQSQSTTSERESDVIPATTAGISNRDSEALLRLRSPLALPQASISESSSVGADRIAVTAEIPTQKNSISQTTLVWRKSTDESSRPLSLSTTGNSSTNNGQAIARQTSTAFSPIPTSQAETGSTLSNPAMQMPEVNVAQIAEQVSRILSRQLIVERERRGISR
ncbi:MAG TPA: hypothetical protein V6C91_07785, partial [Coleofasciculaceae cyanobacterium]